MTMQWALPFSNGQTKDEMEQWLDDIQHHDIVSRNKDIMVGRCLFNNPSAKRDQMIESLLHQMSIHWSRYQCDVITTVLCECFHPQTDHHLYHYLSGLIRNGQARRTIHDLFQLPLWLHIMDQWDDAMIHD